MSGVADAIKASRVVISFRQADDFPGIKVTGRRGTTRCSGYTLYGRDVAFGLKYRVNDVAQRACPRVQTWSWSWDNRRRGRDPF